MIIEITNNNYFNLTQRTWIYWWYNKHKLILPFRTTSNFLYLYPPVCVCVSMCVRVCKYNRKQWKTQIDRFLPFVFIQIFSYMNSTFLCFLFHLIVPFYFFYISYELFFPNRNTNIVKYTYIYVHINFFRIPQTDKLYSKKDLYTNVIH